MSLSIEERNRRYAAIRKLMGKNGLDSLVIHSRESHRSRGNTRYITNYGIPAADELILFPLEGEPCAVGSLDSAAISRVGWVNKFTKAGMAESAKRTEQLIQELSNLRKKGTMGIVGMASIPVQVYSAVQTKFPGRVVDADWIFKEVRSIKSAEEIEKMRISSSIADKTFRVIKKILKPGLSDFKILSEAKRVIHENGCAYSMELIGIHAGLVGFPWGDIMGAQDRLRFEITPAFEGYYSQILADFRVSEIPPQVQKLIPVWKAALGAGMNSLRPGVKVSDVDQAVSTVVREMGYTPLSGRHGHDIGLDIIDYILLHPSDNTELKSGMTIALHPGVTAGSENDVDNLFGGYTYLVTDKGAEKLNKISIFGNAT